MSTAQWYRILVEQNITMVEQEDNTRKYVMSRIEAAAPDNDWELTWKRARLRGLGAQAYSFLWKLLHNILPTEERLLRILPNTAAQCKYCPFPARADLTHCLFQCNNTKEVGSWLLSILKHHDQSITAQKLLRLEFECSDSAEMPLVWIAA